MKNKGFTLIEMLIVISILGILAAVVLPRFSSSSANSKANSHKYDRNNIDKQIESYYTNIGSYPTAMTTAGWGGAAVAAKYWPNAQGTATVPANCNAAAPTAWVIAATNRITLVNILGDHTAVGDKHELST